MTMERLPRTIPSLQPAQRSAAKSEPIFRSCSPTGSGTASEWLSTRKLGISGNRRTATGSDHGPGLAYLRIQEPGDCFARIEFATTPMATDEHRRYTGTGTLQTVHDSGHPLFRSGVQLEICR